MTASLLSKAKSGVQQQTLMTIIYGVQGIGKTTFASKYPKPLFIDLENGSFGLDVQRITKDEITSIDEVYALVDSLITDKQTYKTLVIDSITSLQPYIYMKVSGETAVGKYIEDVEYAKNHKKAVEEVTRFVKKLQQLKDSGMNVVVLGHSKVKQFNDPSTEKPYDRFIIDCLYEDFGGVFSKYADNVFFGKYETEKVGENGKHKSKYNATGKRILQTEWRPTADCKNRIGLPAEVEFDYDVIEALRTDSKEATPEQLIKVIKALLSKADESIKDSATQALAKAGTNKEHLLRVKNKVMTFVGAVQ